MGMKRRDMEKWLASKGFRELPRGSNGHSTWEGRGLKISLSAHEDEVSKGVVAQIVRRLEAAGFERKVLRRELRGS